MELLGDKERYPFKNEVIQYFKDYSKQFKLPVRTKQHVSYVEKPNEVIKIYTVSGEEARQKGASTDKQMLLLFHEEFG